MDSSTVKMPGAPPRWVNRLMSALLRTPGVRRLLGKGFALITVTGAVSGRSYTTPVQHLPHGDGYVVLSQVHRRWWRNIAANPAVTLLVRGEKIAAHATIAADAAARSVLAECLSQRPRIAKFYRIPVEDGVPGAAGIDALATRVVVILIDPAARGPVS
jgi:deazaflavin-dependent oxidoreductase (nitroreductase family)